MSQPAIELHDVTRFFGSKRALDRLTLSVPAGSIFGLLGPNGAGKTTAIRILMGHLHLTKGQVRTLGSDPWQHDEATRRRIAYVSENMAIPGWMTARAAIRFSAKLYPAWNAPLAQTLLDEFHLAGRQRFSRLSKGQKRAVCIILALCQNADLLVLDEPAAGLDTTARRRFLERILDVACEGGRTAFIASHILSDLERVVDRVAILCNGRLELTGQLEDLKQSARKLHLPGDVKAADLAGRFNLLRHEIERGETVATVLGFDEERFQAFCAEHGCAEGARQFGLNLEDLFVEVAQSNANRDKGE